MTKIAAPGPSERVHVASRIRRPWLLAEREATDEGALLDRRRFLEVAAGSLVAMAAAPGAMAAVSSGRAAGPRAVLRNECFPIDRQLTDEVVAATLNHYVELTPDRDAHRFAASAWVLSRVVRVTGLVERPLWLDVDDLHRLASLEERVYRHRCVEGWAAAVPWRGVPLAAVLRAARPLRAARYVRFVGQPPTGVAPVATAAPATAPATYSEGLTVAEALHELTFLATGIYGHELPVQHGAPVRLVVPWKYAHKSIKAIAQIELTATRPGTYWNDVAPHEYPFLANVDPLVPHPRWSQRSEKMLGSGEVRATLPFNGYGEWVANLYA